MSIKRLPLFLAMVVLAATFALKLGAGSRAAISTRAAVSPTMHALVREDATFGLTFDDGSDVGSQGRTPPTIPAGTYTIRVIDNATIHNFHLSGPGVNLSTPIDEMASPTWTATFQAGGTYKYVCDDHVDFMFGAFEVSGTSSGGSSSGGTSSGGTSSGATSGGTSSGGTSSSGGGTTLNGGGGAAFAVRATLAGTVSAAGKLTLALKGKAVSKLTSGRYKFMVVDKSKTKSFMLQQSGHSAKVISSASFVGTHSVTLTLSAGSWSFYASAGGSKRTFVVS